MSGEAVGPEKVDLAWFKSSYSAGDGGQCVEVAAEIGVLYVRDSKRRTGPALSLAPTAWTEFIGFATGIRERGVE
ncbi:DUF397 domain-containing protein [Streptomyces sp. NPDC005195]|uniref:DUF397 domain-containing protein n=1 Tax=Streptomyces sp. NPDC005195 TaxID=3154561 RepID=UPI0033A2D469